MDHMTSAAGVLSPSLRLRQVADPIWERTFHHPIVQGIGSGATPLEHFTYFLRQDYIYLIEFSRLFAHAAIKSPTLESLTFFARLMQGTLATEMALHRTVCQSIGISAEELERTEPGPTTLSYTSFLLSVAQGGTLVEILASVLPCFWGYAEIGERLAARGRPVDQPLYAAWIDSYTAPEYHAMCAGLRATFDDLAADVPPAMLARLERLFIYGSRYEYLFWEAARTLETWPV